MSEVNDFYMARVYLAQARACHGNPVKRGWRHTLLAWAANRRRRGAKAAAPAMGQLDLFGGRNVPG